MTYLNFPFMIPYLRGARVCNDPLFGARSAHRDLIATWIQENSDPIRADRNVPATAIAEPVAPRGVSLLPKTSTYASAGSVCLACYLGCIAQFEPITYHLKVTYHVWNGIKRHAQFRHHPSSLS